MKAPRSDRATLREIAHRSAGRSSLGEAERERERIIRDAIKNGDRVIYRPHGIGKVEGTEMKGPGGCACFAVSFPSGMRAFIPVDTAESVLRPLASRAEAESDLEILRGECAGPDKRFHKEKRDERTRILRTGTRREIAAVLRTLYAGKPPISETDGAAIRVFEDLVLEEISLVLGVPRAELEHEMRERHPVFKKKEKKVAAAK